MINYYQICRYNIFSTIFNYSYIFDLIKYKDNNNPKIYPDNGNLNSLIKKLLPHLIKIN